MVVPSLDEVHPGLPPMSGFPARREAHCSCLKRIHMVVQLERVESLRPACSRLPSLRLRPTEPHDRHPSRQREIPGDAAPARF